MSIPATLRVIREEHHALKSILQSMHLLIQQGAEQESMRFFRALRAMLFYIDQYPERLHHPKETELLFPKIPKTDPVTAQAIAKLDSDHEKSQHAVRELQHLLLEWEFLGEGDREKFVNAFEKYKQAYLDHMQLEESVVLPAAINHLSPEAWKQIDDAFEQNRDPLTGKYSNTGVYEELFSRIAHDAPSPIGLGGALQ